MQELNISKNRRNREVNKGTIMRLDPAHSGNQRLELTEAYLGHQEKKLLICPGKIIILPGQDNHTLICPGKITTH